ncbi:DNA polymerase III subunit beta [Fusobacterium sp. PH5-44]|uniref:DNA polymerase III subunit beta n=1 Tax=unclassified Fusobacterium TaxID=2648384 RepID=UPI003D258098
MIFKVKREEFLKGIKTVEKAIFDNKIKPIISCAYMEARERELLFCGTNLEMTIITTIPCDDVIAEGKIVFQHDIVQEYVNELKDDKITVSISEDNLLIEGEDSSSEFTLMNPDDYPKIPIDSEFDSKEENFVIDSKILVDLFEKIKFAASTSNEKLSMNCVRMESEGNNIRFIATDAYRLAYLEYKMPKVNKDVKVSIPLVAVDAVVKILNTNENKNVKFYTEEGKVFFKSDDTLTISRVIDLEFHNYGVVLNNNQYDKKLIIGGDEFNKILKRVMIFSRNNAEAKYGGIFEINNLELVIEGENDVAQVRETAEVNYVGDDIKIGLNVKFILDFTQNLTKNDEICVELMNPNSFVRFSISENSKQEKTVEDNNSEDKEIETNIEEKSDAEEVVEKIENDAKNSYIEKYTYIVMPYAYKK